MLLAGRLKELLDEEASMSKENLKKIQNRWLEVLRVEKFQSLKGDIDILRNSFEKTVDRKNAVIQMLAADLEEAEEQHRLAIRTHLGNIDALIDLQQRRAQDLDSKFEEELSKMRRAFELEWSEIQAKHNIEKNDLRLILANMKREADIENRQLEEETSQGHDTAIEKMEQERNGMRTEMESQVQAVREKIQNLYSKFDSHMTSSMRDYMEKTKEDEKSAKEIEGKMKKIQKLQESIATMKSNLGNNVRECEERDAAMRAEKDIIARHFKELKLKMHTWRRKEQAHLAELVTNAKKTSSALGEKAKQAERILRLVELARQLETEREKVLRFDADVTAVEAQQDVAARVTRFLDEQELLNDSERNHDVLSMKQLLLMGQDAGLAMSSPGDSSTHSNPETMAGTATTAMLMPSTMTSSNRSIIDGGFTGLTSGDNNNDANIPRSEEWKLMERFWLRHNKVCLDNAAIEQEKFHLQNENAKLRSLLMQYMDGISVNHEVMGKANNLLETKACAVIPPVGGAGEARKLNNRRFGGHGSGRTVTDGNKVYSEVMLQTHNVC